jgi:hypothetical protein
MAKLSGPVARVARLDLAIASPTLTVSSSIRSSFRMRDARDLRSRISQSISRAMSGMQAQEDQSAFTPSRLEKRKIVSELVSLLEKCGSK